MRKWVLGTAILESHGIKIQQKKTTIYEIL